MAEKFLGYVLLAVGIAIISITGINAYDVFTGKAEPVNVYKAAAAAVPQITVQPAQGKADVSALIQPLIQSAIGQSMGGNMEKPINMTIHLLFIGFIATVGYKLASIGAMLVRPIVVEVKGVPSTPPTPAA
jgi:hypothetical protein